MDWMNQILPDVISGCIVGAIGFLAGSVYSSYIKKDGKVIPYNLLKKLVWYDVQLKKKYQNVDFLFLQLTKKSI
jgi:hypothetical protein